MGQAIAISRIKSVTIRQVMHRFSNLLAGLALLLGLATVALWCRSLGTEDQWRWERHDAGVWQSLSINSRRGELSVTLGSVSYWGENDPSPSRGECAHQSTKITDIATTAITPATHLGFGYGHYLPSAPPGEICKLSMLRLPHWLFLTPAMLAGARWYGKHRPRMARQTIDHNSPTA